MKKNKKNQDVAPVNQDMVGKNGKPKKEKKKYKVDWTMIWPILAILVFGVLGCIAFVSMGFGVSVQSVKGNGWSALIPVGKLSGENPTYGATISGIVIAFCAVIVPFAMMFWSPSKKLTKWLGIIPVVMVLLAAALMFAGIGLFCRDFHKFAGIVPADSINGGAITGIVIIVLVGFLIGLAGVVRGFYGFNLRTFKFKGSKNKDNKKSDNNKSVEEKTTTTVMPVETPENSERTQKVIVNQNVETTKVKHDPFSHDEKETITDKSTTTTKDVPVERVVKDELNDTEEKEDTL
ncbi:hypothetical protein [Mesoplasma lactucae]|uniref:Uncharacterized protein n=1 Tax=Mesoplasma lactucae ATCC 49193 TaxID=81460 RepID=A0A291IRT4_9MOLU|nr:hypothetical protein [Mesoplasma lactucae]ATG97426.1 hypothetical protein CP520_01465 [Mesoplasma lactucae ATCC 49193]ATZ20121.1 hypothetical protein MLACT_v1c03000 [Mesoplasma lactucae ATCC 49193]MCL8216869.1 hypothetical protein [Mesoplasma lactucae ATCC 49193]